MFSNNDIRQIIKIIRQPLFAAAMLIGLIGVGFTIHKVWAVSASRATDSFELAKDFPRGAVVYAQFNDLPAAIKQWDESALKDRYLASANQQKFWSRHLANKLFSRWEEFNDATGFSLSASVFSAIADKQAAIAVYDIGRLDLILIAPLDEGRFAATQFLQNKESFEEREALDGTVYYLSDVEADKGRQKQQIGFAHLKGKFALATSEKLLLRAIANIGGQAKKDRLADEPSFQTLCKSATPHFATVWVDQAALNDDWYFKKYWVMQNAADLKNIRAGMFDLEMQNNRWVERRDFLLSGKAGKAIAPISKQSLRQIEGLLPAGAPFAQIRSVGATVGGLSAVDDILRDALFDGETGNARKSRHWNWSYYGDSDFEVGSEAEQFSGYSRYSSLDYRYNLEVDDSDDAGEAGANEFNDSRFRLKGQEKLSASLRAALQPANPMAVAKIAEPRAMEGPLFAEFRRAAIVVLENPALLQPASVERAIAGLAANRLMIAGATASFEWKDHSANGSAWREMRLSALGRSVGYGLRGKCLILSNSPDLLASLMTEKMAGNRAESSAELQSDSPASELTIIRMSERKTAFDQVFAKLDEQKIKAYWKERRGEEIETLSPNEPSMEFFSGEIASLLNVASPVNQIRIQRSYSGGKLHEEVSMILK
jgi:hypothetical protein